MEPAIWVAIITSIASVAVALIGAWTIIRKRDADSREAANKAEEKFKLEMMARDTAASEAAKKAEAQFKANMLEMIGEFKKDFQLILYRIGQLEDEQRKSNNVKERLTRNEESTKSAHHRINELGAKL